MKGKTKSQTIYDLKRNIRALNYYLENYIKPHEEEVMKKQIENTPKLSSGAFIPDSYRFEYLIADMEDCLKTVKKLKVR